MKSTGILALASAFALSHASSTVSKPKPVIDLTSRGFGDIDDLIREGIDKATDAVGDVVEDVVDLTATTEFSLDHSFSGRTLYEGSYPIPQGSIDLSLVCTDCWTQGKVVTEINIINDPSIRLEFMGAKAWVDVDIDISANAALSFDLFTTKTPIGLKVKGLAAGLVFVVELAFDIEAAAQISTGFWVEIPDHSFIDIDIIDGKLQDSAFHSMKSGSLPITVDTGSAKITADLQLRVQLGIEAKGKELGIPRLGAGAVVAVYANVIEVIAEVTYTPACPLQADIEYNFNFGAYAAASVAVKNGSELGVSPTKSTTLYSTKLLSTCFITGTASSSAGEANSTVPLSPRTAVGERAIRAPPITLAPRAVPLVTLREPEATDAPVARGVHLSPREHIVPASITLTALATPKVGTVGIDL